MKPSAVLLLVLVAVGALIVAITQFGGDSGQSTIDGLGPETIDAPRDVGSLDAPEVPQPMVDPNQRTAAPTTGLAADQDMAAPTNDPNRLSGTVSDQNLVPIAGAKVRLTRVSATGILLADNDHDPSTDRVTESDANGNYQFAGIEPFERYVLVATHGEFRRTEVVDVSVGDAGEFTEMIVMLAGHKLAGFVFDEAKNPVPGAHVQLDGVYGPTAPDHHDDRLITQTDETGYYEFPNSTVGHHTLSVSADGYANQIVRGMQFIEGKGPDKRDVYLKIAERIAGRVVGPDGAGLEGVDILAVSVSNSNKQCRDETVSITDGSFDLGALSEGKYTIVAKMEGYRLQRSHRVDTGTTDVLLQMRRLSSVTGVVLGPDGVAPPSYEVRLRRTHANTDQTTETNVKGKFANSDGSFEIAVPADGTYLVEGRAKDYAPSFSQPFRIQDGSDFDGVTVNLSIGGVITGVVFSSNGDPVSGAVVSTHTNEFMNDEFDAFLGSMNATSVKVRTNNEGKFRIQGLRPDTYQIRVKSSGHVEYIKQDIAVRENSPNDVGALRLTAGGTVRGVVFDNRRNTATAITVTLTSDTRGRADLPRTYRAKTDGNGAFVFGNVAAGPYLISAKDPNAGLDGDFTELIRDPKQNMSRRIVVNEGEEIKYDLKL